MLLPNLARRGTDEIIDLGSILSDMSTTKFSRLLSHVTSEGAGSEEITTRLYPAVYEELRTTAARLMSAEAAGHTLAPTDLVHEAYVKLVGGATVRWQDRTHFLATAARAMRQILVDHARRRATAKRGGEWQRISLSSATAIGSTHEEDTLSLNRALDRLAENEPRMARLVELRVFAGMTAEETAHILGISSGTAKSEWKVARLWLAREMRT